MPVQLMLAMPLWLRLLMLFLLGICVGGLLNLGIYRLAWFSRLISPWSPAPPQASPRTWLDRIPVYGWLRLRREVPIHGTGFWVRPLLVELGFGLSIAWLYLWVVIGQRQYALRGLDYPILPVDVTLPTEVLHWQFFAQVLLLALMIVATFIDVDEKTIPDGVTLTGTVLALILAAAVPHSLPGQLEFWPMARTLATQTPISPAVQLAIGPNNQMFHEVVTLSTPKPFPAELQGRPNGQGLCLGLSCYWLWCFAFAPRPWYPRHGLRRAFQIATARFLRSLRRPLILGMFLVGTVAVTGIWWSGGDSWIGLLTALIGLAASGGIVWLVRIIGAVTLRKEAMGFGDVLLMMMIGSFIGWQAGMMVFFLAPGAGLIVGVGQLILHRDQYIPYGPFLCLATAGVVLFWAHAWDYARPLFDLGVYLPLILLGCMGLMAVMLAVYQWLKDLFLEGVSARAK